YINFPHSQLIDNTHVYAYAKQYHYIHLATQLRVYLLQVIQVLYLRVFSQDLYMY
ncbi:MAG: hypothetical protein FD143_3609, partial [Ignavibacteria bacterium]